jgi:ribosomal protein L12E/L44/L45/RPP1/RPP2
VGTWTWNNHTDSFSSGNKYADRVSLIHSFYLCV